MLGSVFTVGAITALTKKTIDYAGRLNDLSSRLGVSTDFLQEFRYVAQQAGVDFDKLTAVMEQFNKSRQEALGGNKKKLAALGEFGITPGQVGRNEDLIFGPIAKAFEKGDAQ